MKKIELEKKDILSLIISILIGAIFLVLGLFIVGNQNEVYHDIIIETLARSDMNITLELKVFWIILFLSIPILILLNYFLSKSKKGNSKDDSIFYTNAQIIMNLANIVYYLLSEEFCIPLFFISVVYFINHQINYKKEKEGLILPIIIYYFVFAFITLYYYIGGAKIISLTLVLLIVTLIDIILFLADKKKNIINKALAIMQIFIPLTMLIYICQRYRYNNQMLNVNFPLMAYIFFYGIICVMIIYSIYKLIKNWKHLDKISLNCLILTSTCILIFALNSVFVQTELVIPEDLHHPAENIISYQQIFEKGQIAYKDYSPLSGLFPIFVGFVLKLLGGGFSAYYLANTIYMLFFAMLTMYFFTKHISKEYCLCAGILFALPGYNRIVFILISILILLLLKLIQNKNLWLKIWIWLCFIGGVYYPTFGGAVLIGTLPFGIYQFISFFKSDEFKKKRRKINFYLWWLITLIPIILCVPLLIRMAKHILLYASQTNLADGIAVFGSTIPETFMPYLIYYSFLRTIIYYGVRYIIPISFVLLFGLLLCIIMKNNKWKDIIKSEQFLAIFSGFVILIISYTSVIVRNDQYLLASRPRFIFVLIGGLLFYLIIKKYSKANIFSSILLGLIFGLFITLKCSGVSMLYKTIYSHDVNDGYILIDEDLKKKYPNIGDGFIKQETLEELEKCKANELLKYDPNLKFIAYGRLGTYYMEDVTIVGQPSVHAAKDYNTHKEIIDAIEKQRPVVGLVYSSVIANLSNHYLYQWILTKDDYVYDKYYDAFLPIELFEKIYGKKALPTDKREISVYTTDVEKVSNALGKSIQTLKQRLKDTSVRPNISSCKFKDNETSYDIDLDKEVYGVDANYLYVKFDLKDEISKYKNNLNWKQKVLKQNYFDKATVEVNWGDDTKDSIVSILGNGELLIPLNVNVNWLLNNHKEFKITIKNMPDEVKIEKLEFYKLEI